MDAAIVDGARREVKLQKKIPIAWIYMTGWMKCDGTIQFRNDIYGSDEGVEPGPADRPEARTAAAGMMPSARRRAQGSYLDSR